MITKYQVRITALDERGQCQAGALMTIPAKGSVSVDWLAKRMQDALRDIDARVAAGPAQPDRGAKKP